MTVKNEPEPADTQQLLDEIRSGDSSATERLLDRHRTKLRQMVALRMDPQVAARVDPSDVVQEALVVAIERLPQYLSAPVIPFYPWLRRIAWDRLLAMHRQHVLASRRSTLREQPPPLSDRSSLLLAEQLLTSGTSPSRQLMREELLARVRRALGQLDSVDREILVLRYLEQLSTAEVAAVLGVSENNAKVKHFRAVQRIRRILDADTLEDEL